MARQTGPVCKLCRREALKLFLKGDRCYTDKCGFERRSYPPGPQAQGRKKMSEYAIQLREKQKVKRIYGLNETQFGRIFEKAERAKGITGENLISFLERRLDNVVYRMGFACSRGEARMLVTQGHFTVNGKKVNMPSFAVKPNDVVELKTAMRESAHIGENLKSVDRRGVPAWVVLDKGAFKGSISRAPKRDDVTMPIEEHLIVELYSK
ncbi:MAG: 30S ribosomal protein S4 [Deltaproteobacteria bacterium]|nr:30S ribosomal protein S4 [Deltaproteobacteria bacterium]